MIRPEVEKLRGMVFTPEEMDEIITPILNDSRNRTYVEEDTVAPGSDVAILADELETQKHLIAWRFLHKTPHIMEISPMWCCNRKDARFLAVEAFEVAGYDPSKYDFDVKAKTDGGFRVDVTRR